MIYFSMTTRFFRRYSMLQRRYLVSIQISIRDRISKRIFFVIILLWCSPMLKSFFFSGTTLCFFWKSIQSYQHSSTSLRDKGLTAKQIQRFNRGRGIFALILCAVYPLMYRHLPDDMLQDTTFCRAVAAMVVSITLYQYTLIRDYGKALFIVYGGSKLGFSLQLMFNGSLYSLRESSPYLLNFFEKEALLISCWWACVIIVEVCCYYFRLTRDWPITLFEVWNSVSFGITVNREGLSRSNSLKMHVSVIILLWCMFSLVKWWRISGGIVCHSQSLG